MNEIIKISIATDFSETPGARYAWDWQFSWETFYKNILKKNFDKLEEGDILELNLDNIYYPPSSFLSESFGPLYKENGGEVIWDKIHFISKDDPTLIDIIKLYAREYDQ